MKQTLRITFIFTSVIALSFLLEAYIYSSLPGSVFVYPIVKNYQDGFLWFLKHLLIGSSLVLASYIVSKKELSKGIRFSLSLCLGFLLSLAARIGYPYNWFLGKTSGSEFEGIEYPFSLIHYLLIGALVFYILHYVFKEANPKKLSIFFSASLMIIIYALGYAWITVILLNKIPLNNSILRDQERFSSSISFSHPAGAGFAIRTSTTGIYEDLFIDYQKIGEKMTKDQWLNTCSFYRYISLGLNIFGNRAADSCFYIGGIIYKDPMLCKKANKQDVICLMDLVTITKNVNFCGDNQKCRNANINPIADCGTLKTVEDASKPAYIPEELTPYSQCLFNNEKIKQSIYPTSDTSYEALVPLFNKILILNCEVQTSKDGPFIILNNRSNDVVSTKNLKLFFGHNDIGTLPLETIKPGSTRVDLESLKENLKEIALENKYQKNFFEIYYKDYTWSISSCSHGFYAYDLE